MDQDYCLPNFSKLVDEFLTPTINKLGDKCSPDLFKRYRRFHALATYFEYAVAMVKSQEIACTNKDLHSVNQIICASALSANNFIFDSINFLNEIMSGITADKDLAIEVRITRKYLEKLNKRVETIRHSLVAHPEAPRQGETVAEKRSMYGTDGRVKIGGNIIHPRKDLEDLRKIIEQFGILLLDKFKNTCFFIDDAFLASAKRRPWE